MHPEHMHTKICTGGWKHCTETPFAPDIGVDTGSTHIPCNLNRSGLGPNHPSIYIHVFHWLVQPQQMLGHTLCLTLTKPNQLHIFFCVGLISADDHVLPVTHSVLKVTPYMSTFVCLVFQCHFTGTLLPCKLQLVSFMTMAYALQMQGWSPLRCAMAAWKDPTSALATPQVTKLVVKA